MMRCLLLLALSPALFGHLLVDIFGELRWENDTVTLVLSTDRNALLLAIKQGALTLDPKADLTAHLPTMEAYLASTLALNQDGKVLFPEKVTYAPTRTISGKEHNPSDGRLAFVATWHVAEAKQLRLLSLVFTGLNFPSVFQIRQPGTNAEEALLQPGEMCDVNAASPAPPDSAATVQPPKPKARFFDFLRLGYLHIVPEGLDHILFVLGLYLICVRLKPLFIQITAFTVAHSITLALALTNVVQVSSRVVEPIIAASIAFVAIENIFIRSIKPWRWMVVFLFGLVHGLGFAASIKDLFAERETDFVSALVGFNLGVEGGQISVVAAAAVLTAWFWHKPWYRRFVVIPGSMVIAVIGLYWAFMRTFVSG